MDGDVRGLRPAPARRASRSVVSCLIEEALDSYADGARAPRLILDGDRIVGRITLSNIVRGPFQSCNLGYWVNQADNGRGLATAAVGDIMRVAFSGTTTRSTRP